MTRNSRLTQRIQPPVRAQLELDHLQTMNAHYNDDAYRRRYIHEKFSPEQIARALRASKGGIAAASRVPGCTRKTVMRYLDKFPDLTEIAQDEVELALDMAEHSLFVDAPSREPDARRFLLLTRGRSRGYIIRREVTGATGQPVNQGDTNNTAILADGNKEQYLAGLRAIRDAARGAGQSVPRDVRPVPVPEHRNDNNRTDHS